MTEETKDIIKHSKFDNAVKSHFEQFWAMI